MNSSACLQTTVLIEDHAEGFTFPEIKTLPGCAVDYYFFFFFQSIQYLTCPRLDFLQTGS